MKKKHIVVLVGSYYPNFSAVGICARNVVDELKKEATITVISQKTDINEKEDEEYDGYNILRTSTRLNALRLYSVNKQNTVSRPFSLFWLMLINLIRIFCFLKAILSKVNIKQDQVDEYIKTLVRIGRGRTIDAILCCSFPFESVLAGIQYKKLHDKQVKVIPYLFDNFVERDGLHRTGWNKRMKWNKHLDLIKVALKESDHLFVMHSLRNHFQTYYTEDVEKITYTEHPLLIETKEKNYKPNKHIGLVYTGAFLKHYVEPYFLVDTLREILEKHPINIDFYVMGNCTKYINELASQFPVNVKNHGKVTFERANQAILAADILLCVAEYSGIQMSSKIFTYMSVGKPIILFYNNENDINKRILSKYPLALFIKQKDENAKEVSERIVSFIEVNKNNKLNFSEVCSLYSDAEPQFTAQKILTIIQ